MKLSILLPMFFILFHLQISQAQRSCCFKLDFYPVSLGPLIITAIDTPPESIAEDVSCSCLTSEGNNTWFSFSAVTAGLFEVLIEHNVPGDNFDFALCSQQLHGGRDRWQWLHRFASGNCFCHHTP